MNNFTVPGGLLPEKFGGGVLHPFVDLFGEF